MNEIFRMEMCTYKKNNNYVELVEYEVWNEQRGKENELERMNRRL